MSSTAHSLQLFEQENDLDRMVEAVELSRKIGRSAPSADLVEHEMGPGAGVLEGHAPAATSSPTSPATSIMLQNARNQAFSQPSLSP